MSKQYTIPVGIHSVTNVAAMLGVTREAILYRIDKGDIPAFRVGRQWNIHIKEPLTLTVNK